MTQSDPGAVYSGVTENYINTKISAYMADALSEYTNVKVYQTRTTDVYLSLQDRADIAKKYNADLFISLHANASTSSSASGVEVYYPNGNYISNYSTSVSYSQTKAVAQKLLDGLTSLGLKNLGIKTRNASDYKYADNSTADYYGVIRNCKNHGIPAVLIEHGFMSNSSDMSNFLSSDAKLKVLALANVKSLVDYFGLTTTTIELSITAPNKTEYNVGDTIDTTGLVVKAKINGVSKTLTSSDYKVSGFSSATTGNKVISVTYEGETSKFVVCVLPVGQEVSSLIGDVNGDGEVKASDYLLIKDSFLEGITLSQSQVNRADVKSDGEIKASDYLMIKDYFMCTLATLPGMAEAVTTMSELELEINQNEDENLDLTTDTVTDDESTDEIVEELHEELIVKELGANEDE